MLFLSVFFNVLFASKNDAVDVQWDDAPVPIIQSDCDLDPVPKNEFVKLLMNYTLPYHEQIKIRKFPLKYKSKCRSLGSVVFAAAILIKIRGIFHRMIGTLHCLHLMCGFQKEQDAFLTV